MIAFTAWLDAHTGDAGLEDDFSQLMDVVMITRKPEPLPPAEEEDILFDESRWMAPAREGPADSHRSRGLLHHEIKRVCRVARGK